jgi:hypothetical protein
MIIIFTLWKEIGKMKIRCPKCGETEKSKFSKNSTRPNGLQTYCKKCHNSMQKAARPRFREIRRITKRARNLRDRYHITIKEYTEIFEKQAENCAICGQPEKMTNHGKLVPLAIDHNHSCCPGKYSCGKCIRGLLCVRCNTALASWRDNIKTLEKAIEYIRVGMDKTKLGGEKILM